MRAPPPDDQADALGRLYDAYAPTLYRYVLMLLANPPAAEDALPDAFAGLLGSAALTDFTYRAEGLSRVARLVALRTREYVAEGHGDPAAASAIVGLALRRANSDTPIPMAQIDVGEVLSQAQPGEDALRAWGDAALRGAEDPDAVATAIERARGRMIERVWRQTYGPSPTALRTQTLPRPGLLPWVWRPWYSRKIAEDLQAWAEALEVARQTPAARASVVHALEAKRLADGPRSMFQRGRWFKGLWPTGAWVALVSAVQRNTLAHDRVRRVALAIERFRRVEGGRLPASLDASSRASWTRSPMTLSPTRRRCIAARLMGTSCTASVRTSATTAATWANRRSRGGRGVRRTARTLRMSASW